MCCSHVWLDAGFKHNSRGHISMSANKAIFVAFKKVRESIYYVDEYNTSKCCSSCETELYPAILIKKTEIQRTWRRFRRFVARNGAQVLPLEQDQEYPHRHRQSNPPAAIFGICRYPKISLNSSFVDAANSVIPFPPIDDVQVMRPQPRIPDANDRSSSISTRFVPSQ